MQNFATTLKQAVRARPYAAAMLVLLLVFALLFPFLRGSSGGMLMGAASDNASMIEAGSVSSDSSFAYDAGAAPRAQPAEEKSIDVREIITKGALTVKLSNPVEEADAFVAWVEAHGGYVADLRSTSYDSGASLTREAVVTVRMEDINDAVEYLKTRDGEVLEETLKRNDVTAQGADLDARITALRTSIDRLSTFLTEARNYRDLFQIESQLTQRQAELDSIVAQRKALTSQVELQTLVVTLTETEALASPTDEASKGFTDGLREGWNSLISFVTSAVYGAALLAPWLILLIPGGIVTFVFVRRHRRKA